MIVFGFQLSNGRNENEKYFIEFEIFLGGETSLFRHVSAIGKIR